METLPSNAVQYLIGTPVFALFSWRGFVNYRKLHNPLSGYFAISGLLAALFFGLWSIPLLFTHDPTILAYLNALADVFLYSMYVASAALVYYLTLRQRVPRALFMTPFVLLGIIGCAAHAYGYIHNGVSVVNNRFEYQLPPIADFIQIIMLVNVCLVGVFLLTKLPEQSTGRSKSGLIAVAFLYLLSGIAGSLNVLLSENLSPQAVAFAYLAGFAFFVTILALLRVKKPKLN